jgi:sugar phosphate isomerase/epimerase
MKYVISGFTDEAGIDAAEQLKACRDNGIGFIELRNMNGKNLKDLPLSEVVELKKKLDDAGVRVSAAGSPFGKTGVADDFSPELESFKYYVEKMRALDTGKLRFFSFYGALGDPDGFKAEIVDRIGAMMDCAPGILFCHENERAIFGNTAPRCRELYDAFGGRLKLVFDPANFIVDKEDVLAAYDLLEDCIDYFHIKDAVLSSGELVPAGCGGGKIAEILTRFAKNGKDALLSVEPHLKVDDKGKGMAIKTGYIYDTGAEAFGAACSALKGVLESCGFKPVGDGGPGAYAK